MAELFGGHLVAKYLKETEGIDTVFSLSGGHIDRIYDGFVDYGVRLIDVRHEQAAAMMAHAWTVYTEQAGVCLITAGPGFTNALTGLVNAYQENAPVVFISGMAPLKDRGLGALQEIPQADMIKSTTKWCDVCTHVERVPEYLARAFRHAVSGRPGPVLLEIPPDVLHVTADEKEVVWPKKGGLVYRSAPDPEGVRAAVKLINAAQKPVVLGGTGVGLSRCDREIRDFIDTCGSPFVLLSSGRGAVPDDHPLSLWEGGLIGILTALSQADLVIALGVRFNWLLLFGQVCPQAKMVRVDVDATEIDRNRTADVGLVGDLKLALGALNRGLAEKDHTQWRAFLKEANSPLIRGELDLRGAISKPIHPVRMVARVREAVGDDALWVVDGGDTSYYGITGLTALERASVLGTAGGQFGCLGTGIPFAIAAKAARPDKTVVVINGDGSFGLNAMEIDTAVRHNLPFVCVVNNDCAWGMIRHGQQLCYGNDRCIGSELGVVHYERMAEALGGYGELVEEDEDIVPSVKRAVESGRPAVVNILTDPAAVSPATLQFVEGFKMK